jgi:hypothetical protein
MYQGNQVAISECKLSLAGGNYLLKAKASLEYQGE